MIFHFNFQIGSRSRRSTTLKHTFRSYRRLPPSFHPFPLLAPPQCLVKSSRSRWGNAATRSGWSSGSSCAWSMVLRRTARFKSLQRKGCVQCASRRLNTLLPSPRAPSRVFTRSRSLSLSLSPLSLIIADGPEGRLLLPSRRRSAHPARVADGPRAARD